MGREGGEESARAGSKKATVSDVKEREGEEKENVAKDGRR